ncbi:5093_t:CDS:2 [Entrophospora sp. SA101]|nr:5093_t:CDS:2 [Entrophospora sp. SA101]CAJ0837434.1 603_t:CDS:2 [Entrophospora sp. SA101]CAJ0847379.1 2602_t:CDS:2 [Entrophospora sp. SA101]
MPQTRSKTTKAIISSESISSNQNFSSAPVKETTSITSKYFSNSSSSITAKTKVTEEEEGEEEEKKLSPSKVIKSQLTEKRTRKHVTIEIDNVDDPSAITSSPKKKRNVDGNKLFSMVNNPPLNWETVYSSIKEYRKNTIAPVDTMGCNKLADGPNEKITPQTSRFQSLIALMLSSQTKDLITSSTMQYLKKNLPGGLTIDSILKVDEKFLDECISKVGFHNKKANYIKQTAKICKEKYGGDIPDTIEGLLDLPGVGPKMAYLCMHTAWDQNQGIGVDVHVHRISNRLGWSNSEKAGPEATRKSLETWLPHSLWQEINLLLVGFGQTTCLPRNPICSKCPVKNFCPSANI